MSLLVLAIAGAAVAEDGTNVPQRAELIAQARAALARQDFATAIGRLEQADAANPNDAEICAYLAVLMPLINAIHRRFRPFVTQNCWHQKTSTFVQR